MRFPLQNRVVVLTGAASGIGAALAKALAAHGAALALIDVDEAALVRTADVLTQQGARFKTYSADVACTSTLQGLADRVASEFGTASVLINNAGVTLSGRFEQVTEEQFDRVMQVNFTGAVAMTRTFLPQLRVGQPSQVVNLSSIFGIVGVPGQVAYCSSKFALRGFSEALRMELRDTDIGVTVVHPGGVRTNIAKHAAIGPGVTPQALASSRTTAEKLLRMSPNKVAERIVAGIVRRQKRIVIGADAHLLTALQRLLPVAYERFFPGS
jgi:short-subunit dehydrogenase